MPDFPAIDSPAARRSLVAGAEEPSVWGADDFPASATPPAAPKGVWPPPLAVPAAVPMAETQEPAKPNAESNKAKRQRKKSKREPEKSDLDEWLEAREFVTPKRGESKEPAKPKRTESTEPVKLKRTQSTDSAKLKRAEKETVKRSEPAQTSKSTELMRPQRRAPRMADAVQLLAMPQAAQRRAPETPEQWAAQTPVQWAAMTPVQWVAQTPVRWADMTPDEWAAQTPVQWAVPIASTSPRPALPVLARRVPPLPITPTPHQRAPLAIPATSPRPELPAKSAASTPEVQRAALAIPPTPPRPELPAESEASTPEVQRVLTGDWFDELKAHDHTKAQNHARTEYAAHVLGRPCASAFVSREMVLAVAQATQTHQGRPQRAPRAQDYRRGW